MGFDEMPAGDRSIGEVERHPSETTPQDVSRKLKIQKKKHSKSITPWGLE